RRRHTRSYGDWSSDVCSSDLGLTDLVRSSGAISVSTYSPGNDGRGGLASLRGTTSSSPRDDHRQMSRWPAPRPPACPAPATTSRSEERRVGKGWRYPRSRVEY